LENKPLHIVCLDAPSPPDYGGAIDMHFKIRELARHRPVILHYFNYRKDRDAAGLGDCCQEIHSYTRKGFASQWGLDPYIVSSRVNHRLIDRLNADDFPVLLEGVHCAGILPFLGSPRTVVVRMHNDEAMYYQQLASSERNPVKRAFYRLEAMRLRRYQQRMPKHLPLACVSLTDMEVLGDVYGFQNLHFIPSFTAWQTVQGREGLGSYCLYQGNMNVAENREAARWLLTEVFSKIDTPFYIAGKGPGDELSHLAKARSTVTVFADPTAAEMDELVRGAQVNVLPSRNNTGLKLKMLHALFLGRHCVTNAAGVAGTAFGGTVTAAETPSEYIDAIKSLFTRPFTIADREKRAVLADVYSNARNGTALNELL
jgi:hypothetical protein